MDEKKKLEEKIQELQQRERELTSLYAASQVIFSTVNLDQLYEGAMDLVLKVFNADEGSLMVLDSDGKLVITASRGLRDKDLCQIHLRVGERVAGKVAEEKQGRIILGGLDRYPEFHGVDPNQRIRASLVIPLLFQGKLLGVLNLNRTANPEPFTESHLNLGNLFAAQLAQAITNGQSYEDLEKKIRQLKKAYLMLEEAQTQLVESEKLASIGGLVAGVTHELNNPITVIMGYAEMILGMDIPPQMRERLQTVYHASKRCHRIIQDLLMFARKRKPQLETVEPCVLMEEALSLVSDEMKKAEIEVTKRIPRECPAISGDAHQLRQVFLNILVNGCHALQEVTGRKRTFEISVAAGSGHLEISIADNGPGISKENLTKIFDPFFTTKPSGKGTGLGLSLCYGIIKEHGGMISVESEEGAGAVFQIKLPLGISEGGEVSIPKGNEKVKSVLLVDDEEIMRDVVEMVLKEEGYEVETAANGEEALSKLQKRDFDLIISDYIMPRMNGRLFYETLKKTRPRLAQRFMFVTGSIAGGEMTNYFKNNNLPYLIKPVKEADLLARIGQALRPR